MTTSVVIRANHGWPVRVTRIYFGQNVAEVRVEQRVEAGSEQTFHVWDGSDLLIHEIQPDEEKDSKS